jgi:hypothetical protein
MTITGTQASVLGTVRVALTLGGIASAQNQPANEFVYTSGYRLSATSVVASITGPLQRH